MRVLQSFCLLVSAGFQTADVLLRMRPQILTKLASQSSGGAPLLALLDQARRGTSAQQPAPSSGAPCRWCLAGTRQPVLWSCAPLHGPQQLHIPAVPLPANATLLRQLAVKMSRCILWTPFLIHPCTDAAGPPPGEAPSLPRPGSRQGPPPGVPPPSADPNEPAGLREQVCAVARAGCRSHLSQDRCVRCAVPEPQRSAAFAVVGCRCCKPAG